MSIVIKDKSPYRKYINIMYKKRGYYNIVGINDIDKMKGEITFLKKILKEETNKTTRNKIIKIIEWKEEYITDILSHNYMHLDKGRQAVSKYNSNEFNKKMNRVMRRKY